MFCPIIVCLWLCLTICLSLSSSVRPSHHPSVYTRLYVYRFVSRPTDRPPHPRLTPGSQPASQLANLLVRFSASQSICAFISILYVGKCLNSEVVPLMSYQYDDTMINTTLKRDMDNGGSKDIRYRADGQPLILHHIGTYRAVQPSAGVAASRGSSFRKKLLETSPVSDILIRYRLRLQPKFPKSDIIKHFGSEIPEVKRLSNYYLS